MDVMLDFICMGQFDMPEVRRNTKYKIKILAHSGIRTHNPDIWSVML